MEIFSFPKSDITVKVCDIKHDALAVISNETDIFSTNRYLGEKLSFEYNVPATAFINEYDGQTDGLYEIDKTGRVKCSTYFPVDRWLNPTTGEIEVIPDYNATAWTSAGVAAFGVTLGASKVSRSPNHGQELYTLTGGAMGYDYTGGVAGTSQQAELIGVIEAAKTFYRNKFGRYGSCLSYRFGKTDFSKSLMPKYIAARNSNRSDTGDSRTAYGLSKDTGDYCGTPDLLTSRTDRINQASSTRWWDMFNDAGTPYSKADATTYLKGEIAKAIANKGWFNNFTHWHFASAAELEELNVAIDEAIGSNFVWRASYEEAMEYLFLREMIGGVAAFQDGNTIKIVLQKTDPFKSLTTSGISQKLPLDCLTTDISVRIVTTGTILDGTDIATDNGSIRKVSANEFVADIPVGNAVEGVAMCTLSQTGIPTYQNHNKPVATVGANGSTLTVETDLPTKAVLFKHATSAAESTAIVNTRKNTLATSHEFKMVSGYTYSVGLITEMGQSILTDSTSY